MPLVGRARYILVAGGACVALLGMPVAHAQSSPDIAAIRAELMALKAEQAAAAKKIAQLEVLLDASAPAPAAAQPPVATAATAPRPATAPGGQIAATAPVNPAGGSAPGLPPVGAPSRLALSGDLRLRYEANFGDSDGRTRDRLVMRGRLRAAFAVNNWLTIGGQLSTGDPNDPNSTDITLTSFDNDLMVSLEQAYLRGTFGDLTLTGGKIPQSFVRTEMVWDGDISPEGVIATYRKDFGGGTTLRAHGMYFVIDEAPLATDSRMIGAQLQFETAMGPVKLEIAPSYYDYTLRSVAGGDAGDFRTNRFSNGRYLSDFNLLDVVGGLTYSGMGDKWPVRLVVDYVRNFGATTSENTGFGLDLLLGRGTQAGDWRLGYGYAQTGVDAVFAAFSQDNTDLATNYIQHSGFVDYVIAPRVILNATIYRYRPKSPLFTTSFLPDDWINRLRLNMLVNF